MTTFGEHAASPPPNCLTGINFPTIVRLNERTPDGRRIHSDGFDIRNLPEGRALSFKTMFADSGGGHVGSVITGLVDEVSIDDSGVVSGRGWLLDSEHGRDSGKMIQAGALTGNSIDLSAEEYQIDMDMETLRPSIEFTKSKMAATTLVATPAMEGCSVELEDPEFDFGEGAKVLVAAGVGDFADGSFAFTDTATVAVEAEGAESDAPAPPADWFTEIGGNAYPVRIEAPDASGFQEVHGYLFEWGKPHIGLAQHGVNMTPPKNFTDYAYFANGEVLVDDGTFVATGRLLIGGRHAGQGLDWKEAQRHYDDVSDAWADVAIGENKIGGWVHGYVRPGTDPAVVVAARASGTSGDWRRTGGRLELIAALSVNVEGFPKPSGLVRGGRSFSMIGVGALRPTDSGQASLLTPAILEGLDAVVTFAQRLELTELEDHFLVQQRLELGQLEQDLV